MQRTETQKPLVSIGMPVYNAAGTLKRAIESLLGQDYQNIELVISDNASNDETEAISREYAAIDKRVLYHRSALNMGAIWNFNRVFELSTGKYFVWAAHDDMRAKSFITKCVERLEANHDAVLCQAHTEFKVEGNDKVFMIATLDTIEGIKSIPERYSMVYKTLPAIAIYGLMRADAVSKTLLWQKHVATDVAFIQELCLYGEFTQVPEVLFTYLNREKWNTVQQDYAFFFAGGKKPVYYLPFLVLAFAHVRRVLRSHLSTVSKVSLISIIVREEVKTILIKLCLRIASIMNNGKCPTGMLQYAEKKLLNNQNIRVVDKDLFEKRVRQVKIQSWLGKYN